MLLDTLSSVRKKCMLMPSLWKKKHVSSKSHTGKHKTLIPVISPDQKISWESVIYRFFVLVFASITITAASNRVKETKIKAKKEGRVSKNSAMIRTRTAIGRSPAPTILHNFFWSILSFSFFDAVLYPAIRVEPWPERRMMLITRRREKTIQRIAVAGPLEISLSVISFLSLKLSLICNTSLNIGYSGCEKRTRRICLQAGPLERM